MERAGEAEGGPLFVGAVGDGDDAAPPLADARRADEPKRGVDEEEDPPEHVIREVMDVARRWAMGRAPEGCGREEWSTGEGGRRRWIVPPRRMGVR